MQEPFLHCVNDTLHTEHPSAWESVYCLDCRELLHASHNEIMQTWVETSLGEFCINCFAKRANTGETDNYGWRE